MSNLRLSFWRDEAKLDLFSAEKRWKAYWTVSVPIIVSVVGIGVTLYSLSQDWTIVVSILAIMTWPVCFIIEMFTKGGDAGMRLMGSGPIELHQIRQHVDNLCEWMKTSGRIIENPQELKDRVGMMCKDLFGVAPHLGDATQENLTNFLHETVRILESMKPALDPNGQFNANWRPMRWNDDIKDDLIRERRYDPRISSTS